jgi:iron complex outermembrane receptor protein
MKSIFFGIFILSSYYVLGQSTDSTRILNEVNVKAFEANRSISEVAAPVQLIEPKAIARFDNNGILPVLNIYPGIRMEERSPGSYRISIRGSSVRSPFGVRNVKVYWNEIPFTDANGDTYFNLLDINTLGSIEVLKGPSASIYGAGMGGVILLDSKPGKATDGKNNNLSLNTHIGSFGTNNRSVNFTTASAKNNTLLSYSHAGINGYRDHSSMRRDVFNYRSSLYLTDKYTLHLNAFYADLNYQTPGGLNLDQKNENPQNARLATRFTPSSQEQKAAIYEKMLSIGVSQEIRLTDKITTTISIFGNKVNLENPFITNYEIRDQKSIGARNKNVMVLTEGNIKSKAVLGFEFQKTNSVFDVYDNNSGVTGANQFKENIDAFQSSLFAQFDFEFPSKVFLTGGLSLNKQFYNYERINGLKIEQETSGVPVMPRLSVLKVLNPALSAFGSVSRGFSPPTVQEFITIFHPLANIARLNAESGTNYEIGFKGQINGFSYQANIYSLIMNDAIIRGSIEDQDLFTNAGKTSQKGLELFADYQKTFENKSALRLVASADFKNYTYLEFVDKDNVYDGNLIPSVPSETFGFSLDYALNNGLFWNNNLNFTDEIPLNNANSIFSEAYYLLNSRVGWQKSFNSWQLKLYFGGENLLNASYSLGNDINAFGSRYFNPSPTRNCNGGFSLGFSF